MKEIQKFKNFFKNSQILPTRDDNFLLGQFLRGQGAQKYIGCCSTILFGLKLSAPNSAIRNRRRTKQQETHGEIVRREIGGKTLTDTW